MSPTNDLDFKQLFLSGAVVFHGEGTAVRLLIERLRKEAAKAGVRVIRGTVSSRRLWIVEGDGPGS